MPSDPTADELAIVFSLGSTTIHLIPANERDEHLEHDCPCHPDTHHEIDTILIHHAFADREP